MAVVVYWEERKHEMKTLSLLLILFLYSSVFPAQDKHTISGHVRDASTGEELIGVSVCLKSNTKTGTISNVYGFYSLTIQDGEYTIRYSMMGYDAKEISVSLSESLTRNIELSERAVVLDAISVTAEIADDNIRQVEMSSVKLQPAKVREIPVIFGEQDIMKTIQLMPGVVSIGEGESGFSVRGGGTDQNLILLDEAIVYHSSHLLGFFSVFNSDAIKDVKLIKGTASSEYGGRLSSVFDIKMKEGNIKRFSGMGGIGLISSRLTLQAPIVKDKGSFMMSGRRTYFDLFMKLSSDEAVRNSTMYFYDLNLKTNYRFGDNDRVFLSGYFGRDVFGFDDQFGIDWGNKTTTLRWNHIFSNKLFLNSSIIFSKYDYVVGIDWSDELIDIRSSITYYCVKEDFQYFITPEHGLKFGFNTQYHVILPGEISASNESSINEKEVQRKHALENAAYLGHEYDVTDRLRLSYGLRYSSFGVYGPGIVYEYDDDGEPVDSTEYDSREFVMRYDGVEPRLSINYILNESSSTKLSYARNRQYLHLLIPSASITLFSLWHPSTSIIKPGISDQVALGYFRNFDDNNYEASVEVYYKDLKNQVDYKNGADIFINEHVEAELVFGKGVSYGAELLIKKNYGRYTGWLGYTLSRTTRQFDAIDDGKSFLAKQDRTHDVSVVGLYDIGARWTCSAAWVYHTGKAVTFPSGKYEIDGHTVNLYTERNGYRMPAYHRLDLGVTYKVGRASWNFSLYNAYGRRNAYSISFRENEDDPTKTEAVRLALFSFFPSITFNYQW